MTPAEAAKNFEVGMPALARVSRCNAAKPREAACLVYPMPDSRRFLLIVWDERYSLIDHPVAKCIKAAKFATSTNARVAVREAVDFLDQHYPIGKKK
jgi:hypothetical protein